MKITLVKYNILCDTALCNKRSKYKLYTDSFKGDLYLCENCLLELKNTLKRIQIKDENQR